jgi:anti-sigma factor RsiW
MDGTAEEPHWGNVMNLPEDVIRDLLSVYYSGEASEGTRNLVEAYVAEHPELDVPAISLDRLKAFDLALHSSRAPDETIALKRAKRILRWQQVLLGIASTLSLNAISLGFSFEIAGGGIKVHWLSIPGQAPFIAAVAALAVLSWIAYVRVGKRIRTRILG